MRVMLQPGGHSPKQANSPTSTSQMKPASDSGQNSGNSFLSQTRGRKRDRAYHGGDSAKRERSSRTDEGDSGQCKTESSLKYEIAQITEKGGVVDVEGVEKLVHLMQPDCMERKMDLVSRAILVSVMASTTKVDCLNRFMQLRGLPVLDEWLQDIHKGKIGNGNLKDGDKSVEEFLLVLLCALDKLPVNLHALQMCNIGKSVNHLRSHKNIEIQRKARALVDTWKKGVKAEMTNIDANSGSTQAVAAWPSKSRLPEASHGGRRTPSVSNVAMKSSITQNFASKSISLKSSHGESKIKLATSSPGSVKLSSLVASGRDIQHRTSVCSSSDASQNREDRSSSSNQSHNYGHSSSSKDEVKSSASGSATVHKISNSTHNKKINDFPGISATGSQKETNSSKGSLAHKSTALEKKSHSALISETVVEGPIIDGSSHKLIVKIPNRIRSPAQGVSGGFQEDPTFMSSRASSPVLRNEQSDDVSKDKSNAYRCNAALDVNMWQNNDPKDALAGSEDDVSHAVLPDEEQSMMTEDSKRRNKGPKTSHFKLEKLHASFSPMNALIESCVKYSEAASSLSLEDDVGMNLLASVAAGEISRSDVVSPTNSTEKNIHVNVELCNDDEAKSKFSPEGFAACDGKKHDVVEGCSCSDSGLRFSKHASLDSSGDTKYAPSPSSEDVPAGEETKESGSLSTNLRSSAEPKREVTEKSIGKIVNSSSALLISMEKVKYGKSDEGIHDEKTSSSNIVADSIPNCRSGEIDVVLTEENDSTDHLSTHEYKPIVEAERSDPLDEGDCNKFVNEGLNRTSSLQQKMMDAIVKSEFGERDNDEKLSLTEKSVSEAGDAVKVGRPNDMDAKSCMLKSEQLNVDKDVDRNAVGESHGSHGAAVLCRASHDLKNHSEEPNVESQKILEHISPPESRCPNSVDREGQKEAELAGFKSSSVQPDEADKGASPSAGAAASGATDLAEKIKFDLNEVLNADDGKCGESVTKTSSILPAVHMINSLEFSVNSVTSGHSASVTVAAAAKGPFIPPEDLLRSKVELRWKGSAATSAFRPAEPRKAFEMPMDQTNLSCPDASTSKHDRLSLDIDLNVPDERALEEMASRGFALAIDSTNESESNCAALLNDLSDSTPVCGSSILDFDLNRVDEINDIGLCSTSSNHNGEASIVHVKPNDSLNVRRDFDLNNGPVVDDASADQISIKQVNCGITSQLPSAGIIMNNPGLGSFSSWFSPGNTYSTVTIPSILPDRVEQSFPVFPPGAPQQIFGSAGVTPFNPDMYSASSVFSSSPAVPLASCPFQFPVFPFGTTYPVPSATFSVGATSLVDSSSGARLFAPPVTSQDLGPVGSFASQFHRPYVVSLPNTSNNGRLGSHRKSGRQGLDLNAGPGDLESEVMEDMIPVSSSQHFFASSQALPEDQTRMFSVTGSVFKRKDPEGSWESEALRHRQCSWQ